MLRLFCKKPIPTKLMMNCGVSIHGKLCLPNNWAKVSGVIQFSTLFTDLQQSKIACTLFIYSWKIPAIKLHRLKCSPLLHFSTSGHVNHSEPAQVVKIADLALPIF